MYFKDLNYSTTVIVLMYYKTCVRSVENRKGVNGVFNISYSEEQR